MKKSNRQWAIEILGLIIANIIVLIVGVFLNTVFSMVVDSDIGMKVVKIVLVDLWGVFLLFSIWKFINDNFIKK